MLQAFAMRLMHLGFEVYVVGDVTTPHICDGDLFITSSDTGYIATVEALLKIVKKYDSQMVFMTAHPEEELPKQADVIVKIPAQTIKDQIEHRVSAQPMGALFEQAQLIMMEMIVVLLKRDLAITESEMEKQHAIE